MRWKQSNAKSQWLNSANIYFLCTSTYFWRFSFPLMSLPNQLGFPWWCLWEKNTWRSAPALNYCSSKSPTSLPLVFHWPKHFLRPRLSSRGHVAGSRELEILLNIMFATRRSFPFYSQENRGKDRWSNLPKPPQVICGGVRVGAQPPRF